MTKKYILLILSALLYAASFIFSTYVWFLIFMFPIPLLYLALKNKLSFIHGFLWGLIAFSIHLSGASYATALLAQGPWAMRLIPFIGILIYFSFCAGIFFWLTALCSTILQKKQILTLLLWCSMLTILFTFISTYSLTLLGTQEGYCLMDPLLPLAHNAKLLRLLAYVSKSLCTFLLFFVSAAITYVMNTKTMLSLLFFIVASFPWSISLLYNPHNIATPPWISSLYCTPFMTFSHTDCPHSALLSMAQECKNIITKHPEVDIILMPESSCNSMTMFQNQTLFHHFTSQMLGKPIHLIFGSFKLKNNKLYNSLYWLYDGKTEHVFKKRHTILLRERIPQYACFSFLRTLYLNNNLHTNSSKNQRPLLHITPQITLVPYICSELFCNQHPDDIHKKNTILALVNDSAFITPYLPSYIHTLMHLHAQLKAIQWRRDIVYVSYYFATYISMHGDTKKIGRA